MKTKSLLAVISCLILCSSLPAQKTAGKKGFYADEAEALYVVIQKGYYDSAADFYRETFPLKKEKNAFSYLWPICALYQAAAEMDKWKPSSFLPKVSGIVRAYHDPRPPAPGYGSYITSLGGGDRFYDDNQWLGITAMDAYARTKKAADLALGEEIYRYMMTGFDTVLSGGLYWQENRKVSKNTCSNGPGIILALQLYKATKKKAYLDTALLLYNWVNKTLKTPSGLYWDNMRVKDNRIGKAVFSYNTGTMLQSNVYLFECTGDKKYLAEAKTIADSSLPFFYGSGTFRDNLWFNAVLLRGYQHLLQYDKDLKYITGFKACVDEAIKNKKTRDGLFGNGEFLELVPQGGMLEILARFAWLESRYKLSSTSAIKETTQATAN